MTFKGNTLLAALFSLWLTGCQIDVNLPDPGDANPGEQDEGDSSDNGSDDSGDSDDSEGDGSDADPNAKAVDWQCEPEQLRQIPQDAFAPSVAVAPTNCVNDLFSLTGDVAAEVFAESRMISVGHYLEQNATLEADLESAILFLRAGYYVQWYQEDTVGEYSVAVREQSHRALNAILTDARLNQAKPSSVLPEAVTLIDSATLNADFLPTVIKLLNGYNAVRQAERNHSVAVNNAFTVLFRGHQNDDFTAAVLNDQSILAALEAFVTNHQALLGTDEEYILANAVREYGRFLTHDALKPRLRPQLTQWLGQYDMTGATAPLWLAAAEQADYHDQEYCADYGICGFRDTLEEEVLSFEFECPNVAVRLRAQALNTGRAYDICDTLLNQSDRFHQLFATNQTPVNNDLNDELEVIVFDSSSDYTTYAGLFFGISTDNGGMYLEGDPSNPDNQARFIAYRAEWLDDFAVWNLRHEFTHYLDGRFNVQGDFQQSSQYDTVWWTEGMAEYATHLEDNDEAWRLAEQSRLSLSSVLATQYSHGTDQVYRWGYLASRYLLDEQPYEVTTLLGYLRDADFDGYEAYLGQLGSRYDTAFDQWLLDELEARDGSGDSDDGEGDSEDNAQLVNGQPRTMLSSPDAEYFYIYLPEGAHDLRITTTGGSGELTLYGRGGHWPSNDEYDASSGGAGTEANIAVSAPQTGAYYYVRLKSADGFEGVTLTAEYLQQ